MRSIFLVAIITSAVCQAQNSYTFIGELRIKYPPFLNKNYQEILAHQLFIDKWKLKINCAVTPDTLGVELPNSLKPREAYYTNEVKKVEVRIEVPRKMLDEQQTINAVADVVNRMNGKSSGITIPFEIYKSKDSNYRINGNTFKLTKPIEIGAPEEIGVELNMDFLHVALDSLSDEIPQYRQTVEELNAIISSPTDSISLSYSQFSDFSSLLLFLEPFVLDNSPLTIEARGLKSKTIDLIRQLKNLNENIKGNETRIRGLQDHIALNEQLLGSYNLLLKRIRTYYEFLQRILYGRQLIGGHIYQEPLQTRLSIMTKNSGDSSQSKLHFALGTSLLYAVNPLYNVTLTHQDTSARSLVKFQDLSRLQAALTGGVFWSPKKTKRYQDSLTITNELVQKSSFIIGLLFSYSLLPNQNQLPNTSPLGFSSAVGWRADKLGILATTNLKSIWQPRQYFIDQFKSGNQTLTSLDINDNTVFIHKTYLSFGLSLVYFLK